MTEPDASVPSSPLHSPFPSPDVRQTAPSSSRTPAYPPTPRFLIDPTPSSILALLQEADQSSSPKGKGNDLRSALILRHSLKWAIERSDFDLISWLTNLTGEWAQILDSEVQVMEDEDGWGIVGMGIQSSCGRQESEEGVRLLVSRWGINIGPRGGCDRSGWTPLHLASIISTPPLISFLLNRGASPHALTNRGLTPLDLVSGMEDRMDIAVFLEHGSTSALIPIQEESSNTSATRQQMLKRRREKAAGKLRKMEGSERKWRVEMDREKWIRDMASIVDASPELLFPNSRRGSRRSDDSGIGSMDHPWDDDSDGEDQVEEGIGDTVSTDSSFPAHHSWVRTMTCWCSPSTNSLASSTSSSHRIDLIPHHCPAEHSLPMPSFYTPGSLVTVVMMLGSRN